MGQVTGVDEVVDHIEDAARYGIEAQLRADGGVMAPTVFILLEDLEQPFMGQLSCRRFYSGADAAAAVMTMGVLPAVMAATRLVVVWEAQDLNVALEAPVDPDGSALCVLDAPLVPPSVLRRHPMRLRHAVPGGSLVIVPEWGTPDRLHSPVLPDSIEQLLHVWREGWELSTGEVVNDMTIRLETAGYRMAWAAR